MAHHHAFSQPAYYSPIGEPSVPLSYIYYGLAILAVLVTTIYMAYKCYNGSVKKDLRKSLLNPQDPKDRQKTLDMLRTLGEEVKAQDEKRRPAN